MTTEAEDQTADVPRWFQAFAEENARQHQELGERISGIAIGLNGKIDAVAADLNGRIDSAATELNGKLDTLLNQTFRPSSNY